MHLKTRNVNTAFRELVTIFRNGGKIETYNNEFAGPQHRFDLVPVTSRPSRNGNVLLIDEPVTITYSHPKERVLFNAARDANPFFHLYESLWMLAGRNDVASVGYYAKQMKEYSDDGETLNGAYGYRWRKVPVGGSKFGDVNSPLACGEWWETVDQLDVLVNHLRADPNSRRAVLSMWNVEDDLLKIGHPYPGDDVRYPNGKWVDDPSKDVCCNLNVMFSLREIQEGYTGWTTPISAVPTRYLDMTVTNRSNDLIWGCLGANIVHFSFLQEYLAARIGVEVGKYNHFTNNLHVYEWNWKPEEWMAADNKDGTYGYDYPVSGFKTVPLERDPAAFERELPLFVEANKSYESFFSDRKAGYEQLTEPFLRDVAYPMLTAFHWYKAIKDGRKDEGDVADALSNIAADDWRIAATGWIERRKKGKEVLK